MRLAPLTRVGRGIRRRGAAVASAAALLLASSSAQATPTTVDAFDVRSNFETLAVTVTYLGDDDFDNSASLFVREAGQAEWREAHRLARSSLAGSRRLAGVVFGLEPATVYEVRVVVVDPDGVAGAEVTATVATRDDSFPTGTGTTHHVDPAGGDPGTGTAADPFSSIQYAINEAGPGDLVVVHPGIYREAVLITKSGTADGYFTLRGEPGAVLDGATGALAAATWSPTGTTTSGQTIYTASVAHGYASDFLYVDGQRLFTYDSLTDLEALAADAAAQSSLSSGYYGASLGGFVQADAAQPGTVVLRDGSNPSSHDVAIPELSNGISVHGASFVVVDGFEVRFFGPRVGDSGTGRGIEVVDSSDVVIQNNRVFGSRYGIRARRSTRVTIQDNRVWDDMSYGLDWGGSFGAYDNAIAHNQGISIEGSYEDHVVRRNVVRGFVDGIVVSDGTGERCENFDIHHNEVLESRDDAIEMDCDDVNGKAWRNLVHENHTALSVSGCDVGPLFVVGNVIYRYFNESLKLHPRAEQGPVFVYHNTSWSGWEPVGGDAGRALEIERDPAMVYVSDHYMTFANNIFAGSEYARLDSQGAPRPDAYQFDYGCWYTSAADRFFRIDDTDFADLAGYRAATGMEAHGVEGDPRFVDPDAFDLHLRPESPCRAAGVALPGINDGFPGDVPDMGAFYVEGSIGPGGGGTAGAGGGGGTGAAGGLGGAGDAGAPSEGATGREDGGCGCRLWGRTHRRASFGWLLLGVLVAAARRRSGRRPAAAVRLR